jgi:hypothetical protein
MKGRKCLTHKLLECGEIVHFFPIKIHHHNKLNYIRGQAIMLYSSTISYTIKAFALKYVLVKKKNIFMYKMSQLYLLSFIYKATMN